MFPIIWGSVMSEWPSDKLTRFEVTRIIGARALQISVGAPILVKLEKDDFDPIIVAEKEFMENKIPMTVRRPMPDDSRVTIDIKKAVQNWLDERKGTIY